MTLKNVYVVQPKENVMTIVNNDSVDNSDIKGNSETTAVEGAAEVQSERDMLRKEMSEIGNKLVTSRLKSFEEKIDRLLNEKISRPAETAAVVAERKTEQVDALLELKAFKEELAAKDAKIAKMREESSVMSALSAVGITDARRQKLAYQSLKSDELIESNEEGVFFKTEEGNASIGKGLETWIKDNQFLVSPRVVQGTGTQGTSKQQINAVSTPKPKEITLGQLLLSKK